MIRNACGGGSRPVFRTSDARLYARVREELGYASDGFSAFWLYGEVRAWAGNRTPSAFDFAVSAPGKSRSGFFFFKLRPKPGRPIAPIAPGPPPPARASHMTRTDPHRNLQETAHSRWSACARAALPCQRPAPIPNAGGRSTGLGVAGRSQWGMNWVPGCMVGQSGVEWAVRMVMHRGTRVAGPSHPATRVEISPIRMRNLDFPRDLRTRARREAPADGAFEVPRRPGRWGRAGGLAGDDRVGAALDRAVDRPRRTRTTPGLRSPG